MARHTSRLLPGGYPESLQTDNLGRGGDELDFNWAAEIIPMRSASSPVIIRPTPEEAFANARRYTSNEGSMPAFVALTSKYVNAESICRESAASS